MSASEFGVIGLGRMGGGLAHLGLDKDLRVVGLSRGSAPRELRNAGLIDVGEIAAFRDCLKPPRIVLLYIPAGPAVDELLESLRGVLQPGDVIADGGNSYWGDSIRRHSRLKKQGFDFIDLGTSGGPSGARSGASFMAGGESPAVAKIEPVVRALFGMLQAISEGFDLLTRYHQPLDIGAVLECWRHGSVIRSWLIELLTEAYKSDPDLQQPSSYIEDTGEVNWLVADALRMEAPIPVIAQSVMQLFASRDERKNWAKAIVAMRHGFGGHPLGRDESVTRERREGRVGDIFRPRAEKNT